MLQDLSMLHSSEAQKPADKAEGERSNSFDDSYQRWYSEAVAVVRQLLPQRLNEFEALYRGEPRRKPSDINVATFTIQDYLTGVRVAPDIYGKKAFDDVAAVFMRLKTQFLILESAEGRFDSALFDLRQVVQADLYDSELESAEALVKVGFGRAAGVICGVVLERHMAKVCTDHSISLKKKHPTISDFNELLKEHSVVDVPTWRMIQRLGDIRNLCGHKKDREPTNEEVLELVSGTGKIIKTVL